jgi:hypothetical protein
MKVVSPRRRPHPVKYTVSTKHRSWTRPAIGPSRRLERALRRTGNHDGRGIRKGIDGRANAAPATRRTGGIRPARIRAEHRAGLPPSGSEWWGNGSAPTPAVERSRTPRRDREGDESARRRERPPGQDPGSCEVSARGGAPRRGASKYPNAREVDTTTFGTVAVWAFLLAALAARVAASRAWIF